MIEILVVMVIIALAAGMLAIGFNIVVGQRLNSEVEKVAYWFESVSETAVFQASVLGVRANEQGFDVVAFYDNRWFPFNEIETFRLSGEFERQIETEERIDFGAEIDDREEDLEPFVAFLPSGQAIPPGSMSFFNDDQVPAVIRWDNSATFSLDGSEEGL